MTSSKYNHQTPNTDKPSWIIGYTTRSHLCIDLDNTSYPKVLSLVNMLMKEYSFIGDCVIMLSSTRKFYQQINYTLPKGIRIQTVRENYHIIFDNEIPYEESCKIIVTLAQLNILDEAYVRIRQMRNDMTLRTNKTVLISHTKPAPKFKAWVKNIHKKSEGNGLEKYLKFYFVSRCL